MKELFYRMSNNVCAGAIPREETAMGKQAGKKGEISIKALDSVSSGLVPEQAGLVPEAKSGLVPERKVKIPPKGYSDVPACFAPKQRKP